MRIALEVPGLQPGRRGATGSSGETIDLTVRGFGADATLGELLEASGLESVITRMLDRTGAGDPEALRVDGRRYHATDPLDVIGLFDGSLVSGITSVPTAPVEISRIAGPGSGQATGLAVGTYDIGTAREASAADGDDLLETPQFRVEVFPDGTAMVTPLDSAVLLDGAHVSGPERAQIVSTTDAVYRIEKAAPPFQRTRSGDQAGRIAMTRSPRLLAPAPAVRIEAPEAPKVPAAPQPLSPLVMLAPIPVGIAMAFVFSPFFLIFMLLSPVVATARFVDGRRRRRRGGVEATAEATRRLDAFFAAISSEADLESRARRDDFLDLHRLRRVANEASAPLWQVRPDQIDFLEVPLGLGPVPWLPLIGGEQTMSGTRAVETAAGILNEAPMTVALADVQAIGVVGNLGVARSVAAGIALTLATRHGPADLEFAALLEPPSLEAWDWLKWLPHLADRSGRRRVALEESGANVVLEELASSRRTSGTAGPTTLLIVDGLAHLQGRVPALARQVNQGEAVAIIVADSPTDLPAFCGAVVEVGDAWTADLVDVDQADLRTPVRIAVADDEVLRQTARALSRYSDPEVSAIGGLLPDRCQLGDLLRSPTTCEGTQQAWFGAAAASGTPSSRASGLTAVLGVCDTGNLEIDLVRDGPHCLIAGTTGAGKSELLRTLVASLAATHDPYRVNFVLIDFKGGGAFDACADLPHTVGLVTDLDEHLAARALRCLKAELKHRERRLRSGGVSDLRDLPPGGEPLPRLVIVIDEFATLAVALPEFLESLVDIAQRGRSLGIHLVLATQRPTGVVDAKIRANTNLRIALRVQDDNDAIDVIDSPAAAHIHRSQPGRGFVRLGAGELVGFQAAIVSDPPAPVQASGVRLEPFHLTDPSAGDHGRNGGIAVAAAGHERRSGPAELRLIADAAQAAARQEELAEPRVPWPPPLPDRLQLCELDASDLTPWTAAIGLADLPDEQRRERFTWSALRDGNVFVFGIDSLAAAGVLGTLAVAIARSHTPDQAHLYTVDFAGALTCLADLPHVGSYLGPDDDERLARLLDHLDTEMEARRARQRASSVGGLGPDEVPLLGLIVANYSGLLEHYEDDGDFEAATRLAAIVRDGPALGVFVFASGTGERGIPLKVAGQVETKLLMRLADSNAYATFGLRARDVPELGPGRAIDVRSGTEIQVARCGVPLELVAADDKRNRASAVPLETLSNDVSLEELAAASAISGDLWRLAIGRRFDDLTPATLDLRTGIHGLVAGPPASGRSTALATIAGAYRTADPTGRIGVIGAGLLRVMGGFDVAGEPHPISTVDQLDQFAVQAALLLVDDIEFVDPAVLKALETLVATTNPSIRLVLAGRSESFRAISPLIRSVVAGRTGLLLRPDADAGDIFRLRLRTRGPYPPGRGALLNGGVGGIIQTARHASEPLRG